MSARLNQIQIPSPCLVPWDSMIGDEKARRCENCGCTVYDLSAMTTREGERLLDRSPQGLCVQIVRRKDGSIVNADSATPTSRRNFAVRSALLISGFLTAFIGCKKDDEPIRLGGAVAAPGASSEPQRTGGKFLPIETESNGERGSQS